MKVSEVFDIENEAENFTRIMAELMAGRLERRVMTLSKGEFGVLMVLSENDSGMSSTQLSEKLNIGLSGVANILRKLEKKAYICRAVNASDRRANVITITGEGRLCLDGRFQQVKRAAMVYMSAMDSQDVHDFNRILRKLLDVSQSITLPD
jgi:DNA-binding MarR family transcriptional regulator